MINLPQRAKRSKKVEETDELFSYIENFSKVEKRKVLEETFELPDSFIQVPFSEGSFLQFLLSLLKVKKVLEIGTFRGFSTVFLSRALPQNGKVYTIEADKRNLAPSTALWKKLKASERIIQLHGPGVKMLEGLQKKKIRFDAIFIDADKRNQKEYLLKSLTLLKEGGVIICDNSLWKGKVVDKNETRESIVYTQKFNDFVKRKFKEKAVLIPAWDGVILIRK